MRISKFIIPSIFCFAASSVYAEGVTTLSTVILSLFLNFSGTTMTDAEIASAMNSLETSDKIVLVENDGNRNPNSYKKPTSDTPLTYHGSIGRKKKLMWGDVYNVIYLLNRGKKNGRYGHIEHRYRSLYNSGKLKFADNDRLIKLTNIDELSKLFSEAQKIQIFNSLGLNPRLSKTDKIEIANFYIDSNALIRTISLEEQFRQRHKLADIGGFFMILLPKRDMSKSMGTQVMYKNCMIPVLDLDGVDYNRFRSDQDDGFTFYTGVSTVDINRYLEKNRDAYYGQ